MILFEALFSFFGRRIFFFLLKFCELESLFKKKIITQWCLGVWFVSCLAWQCHNTDKGSHVHQSITNTTTENMQFVKGQDFQHMYSQVLSCYSSRNPSILVIFLRLSFSEEISSLCRRVAVSAAAVKKKIMVDGENLPERDSEHIPWVFPWKFIFVIKQERKLDILFFELMQPKIFLEEVCLF